MKTCLYTTDYPPARGGVARYLGGLVRYFQGSIDVEVASSGTRWWQAARWFVAHRDVYDQLLLSHVLPMGTAAWVAKRITRKPYVVIVHGMDIGFARRGAVKRFVAGLMLRDAAMVVANSEALEREVREAFGVTRTMVVYPCVGSEIASTSTSPNPSLLRRGNSLDPRVCFLTVARLVPRKGHLRVLEAIAKLRSDHPDLAIDYTIVGDGPERDRISAHIRDLGLAEIVRVVTDAADEQLPALYANADLFVMPVIEDALDREGFGTVYLEAALYGVPSVATNMLGVDEAVRDGETGVLVADGDVAGLADALYRLSINADRRLSLGQAAHDRAIREFVPGVQFEKLRPVIA